MSQNVLTPAPDTPSAHTVQRTMAILECLDGSRRGLNISELSRKLGIPKSSTHVLAVTLERLGYISRVADSRNFRIGLKTYALGQQMVKSVSVSDVALRHLQPLVADVGLCAHLAVLDHDQAVCIQKAEPPNLSRFDTYPGRRLDLHCSSLGKIVLAYAEPETMESILSSRPVLMRYTARTITSSRALRRELFTVRQRQYAVDDEEEELGVRCLAIPLFHPGVPTVTALSVSGTVDELSFSALPELLARLKQCASAIASESIPNSTN